MLVLTRKVNEQIRIGQDIVITVVQLGQGKVRIGVEAPREGPVVRQELIDNQTPSAEPEKVRA